MPKSQDWLFWHTIVELATAIKPFILRDLLAREDVEAVFYFDPDIVLFSRLDDLLAELRDSDIVLTPHQVAPEPSPAGIVDNEIGSLKYGIYNLGFLGVRNTPNARRFADWWAARLTHWCREALDEGLWTDQKWIDHVPVFFDNVRILREPRFNVAPWNLATRQVTGSSLDTLRVEGKELGFYHFTGFDSGAHQVQAQRFAPGNPSVRLLIDWYTKASRTVAGDRLALMPWSFGSYSNGVPIARRDRAIYRQREDLQRAYPDPFDSSGLVTSSGRAPSFFTWLRWYASETPDKTA